MQITGRERQAVLELLKGSPGWDFQNMDFKQSKWIILQWLKYICLVSSARCLSRLLFNEGVCVWLVWPCQMAWWTAWIQTAVCRQPVTPPLCVWAPRTPWTSSRRHRCPLHRATWGLSMTECTSWWAGTAPTSFPVPTPSMESEWQHPVQHSATSSYSPGKRFLSSTLNWIILFLHYRLFLMRQFLVRSYIISWVS